MTLFCSPETDLDGAVQVQTPDLFGLEDEFETIRKAAERNECKGDLFYLLLALRKSENGGPGFEFGVKAVRDSNLDLQAGWASATIVMNKLRFISAEGQDFIEFFADAYCPKETDFTGNQNLKVNLRYWFNKFKRELER